MPPPEKNKSLESWIWDDACSIRGAKDAAKYKDYILPLVFTKRPLKLFGQEYVPETWALANMNMIIHDMEGQIEISDTFKNPKFRDKGGKLRTFDRAIANPMWNQDWFNEADYDADELDRLPAGAGFPGKSSADWGWTQHILASLNDKGRSAIAECLNRADIKEGHHLRKRNLFQDLFRTMFHELMTAKTRVKDSIDPRLQNS